MAKNARPAIVRTKTVIHDFLAGTISLHLKDAVNEWGKRTTSSDHDEQPKQ